MAITVKSLDSPDQAYDFGGAGRYDISVIGDSMVARSILNPGWSWDEYVKPYAEGAQSCPETHHEFVISGRIRYLTDEGDEIFAQPGDHLVIGPGHRAWVVGEEPCLLVDIELGVMEDPTEG
jgi:mannose-6-phosphate isomerase-like protein (cupin superfamily)